MSMRRRPIPGQRLPGPDRRRVSPTGVSGPTTSTPACSRSGSSSSGTPDRRHGGQPGLRPAALLGVRGARQGHPPLHQLARRRHHGPVRHLRHHEVREARRVDLLLRPGGLGRGGPAGRRGPRASASPCPTPGSSCTSPWAGWRARPATSSCRPRRSSACATCSTGCSPTTPARPHEKIAKDTDRDFVMTAEEAVAYGVIDEVITTRDAVAAARSRRRGVGSYQRSEGGRRWRSSGRAGTWSSAASAASRRSRSRS